MTLMRFQFQRGFGYIATIVVLVVLAGLAAALLRLNTTQQATSTFDLEAARAYQAAGAGIQWGLHRTLSNRACPATTTLDLGSGSGFHVTVTCNSFDFNEGEKTPGSALKKRIFSIDVIACNSGSCPDNGAATALHYIERRRVATACITAEAPFAAC